jgi:hypothetical protein
MRQRSVQPATQDLPQPDGYFYSTARLCTKQRQLQCIACGIKYAAAYFSVQKNNPSLASQKIKKFKFNQIYIK